MGEHSEGIAASSGGGENNGLGSCQAHHVGISTTEDRGGAAGAVGKVQSSEEGCLEPREPAAKGAAGFHALSQSHCPDAHLQVMLGLSFANSRQTACCFARCAASPELSFGEIGCAVGFVGSACC